MIYLFYGVAFFIVVVIHTTIIVQLPVFYGFYDILLLFVIYLGFYRSVRESLPFVIVFGMVMDGISGGTFGLYTTSYIWLYIFVLWLTSFIRVTNGMILPGVVACAVLIQNAIFLGYMVLLDPNGNIPSFSIHIVMIQLVWSVFTGPIFITFFKTLVYQMEKWQRSFQSDWH